MATSQMSGVIQYLRSTVLLRDGAGLTDGQLLTDYISRREEAAFAALVRRHGPMVWGVCRRVLRNNHDAEDAFQATFLVLVRKATSIASRELLANWLYGVAHQTALKARATAARRKERERQVTEMPEPAAAEQDFWNDRYALLDEELRRLPKKYRAIIILCNLEGKTRKETARQLGVPEGTVAGWLARARTMLAKRLARYGLAVSGGTLAAVLSHNVASACVPASAVSSTIKAATLVAARQAAATGVIPVKVALLTEGVLKTMLLNKVKRLAAVVLVLAVSGLGAGLYTQQRMQAQQFESELSDRDKSSHSTEADLTTDEEQKTSANREDKPSMAWGKEKNGLQAGIRLESPAGRIHKGDYITFAIVLRNVSKEEVSVRYLEPTGFLCSVDKGRLEFGPTYIGNGRATFFEKVLKPGETWDVIRLTMLTRRPTPRESVYLSAPLGPGKYKVSCPSVLMLDITQPRRDQLATGELEIAIVAEGRSH